MFSLLRTLDFQTVFSIDVRSLALVRIFLAVIALQDLVRRALDIRFFYGDQGVLPTEYLNTFWNGAYTWSLHLFGGGSTSIVLILFVLHGLAAVALLVGYRTRIATGAVWLLMVSLHNANPLILQGEDVLLRVILFVAIFLPLGAVYSVDRFRSRAPQEPTVLSGWTIAYLLQLGFLYFFVALYKHSPEWIHGDAIYYALSIDQYATTFGKYLLNFPEVLSIVTVSVLVFQSMALFLLFAPVYTHYIRTVTALLLMAMHFGFALSMHLAMFSAVSIAGLCGFLPKQLWDAFERFISRTEYGTWVVDKLSIGSLRQEGSEQASVSAMLVSLLGIVYIFYIFLWHCGNVLNPGQYVPFSYGFEIPAKVLRLDQRWTLFAPYPYRDDGWIVVAATLTDGRRVDLFRSGASLSHERPGVIFELYPRPRWRRYFLSLRLPGNARYREPYAQYLCRHWDGPLGSSVKSLEVTHMIEWTPAPGGIQEPPRPVSLIAWDCARGERIENIDRQF